MNKNLKLLFVGMVFVIVGLVFPVLKTLAFVIPDIEKLGKNPEITSLEPHYLIPGDKVILHGKNFFVLPKSANKLKINGKAVRINKATDSTIEFTVPRLKLGSARVELFTSYLGHKSKVFIYPSSDNQIVPVTYKGPVFFRISSTSVKPSDEIYVHGFFDDSKELFFKLGNFAVKGEIISSNTAKLIIPDKLPIGFFDLSLFYKKKIKQDGSVIYFDSAFSDKVRVFSIEHGSPGFIKLSVPKTVFHSLDIAEIPYKAELIFNNGLKKDVTSYLDLFVKGKDVIELDSKNSTFRIKGSGIAEITASYLWEPTKLRLKDSVRIVSALPEIPLFSEVVIDEVFPFASGLFPETDANGDGFAKSDDEFIELKNLTDKVFDIGMCALFINDKTEPAVVFDDNTLIGPNEYFVVFGEFAEKKKLNLSNSGAPIELVCNGVTVDYVYYPKGTNGDPSWQRSPNLGGFTKHPVTIFSPGKPPPQVTKKEEVQDEPKLGIDNSGDEQEEIDNNNDQGNNEDIITGIKAEPEELIFSQNASAVIKVKAVKSDGEEIISDGVQYQVLEGEEIINVDANGNVTPLANGFGIIEITFKNHKVILNVTVDIKSEVKAGELIINEVLAAPDVDVNGDGKFDFSEDEFVEIVNISGMALDISGLILSDKTKVRHIFPFGTVLDNLQPIVVYGGGDFNGASTGSLGLNNSGSEEVKIETSEGDVIDLVEFNNSNIKGVSLNRLVDLEYLEFDFHNNLSSLNFSPGNMVNGLPF